ncbi:MAG: right-handed parallel beta-helix repeat-containing protein [Gemmatimonadetes bacterium]|nr:right-handed parallel beta-helix repeat-containing protein [Gemmatimonadota bacterium]
MRRAKGRGALTRTVQVFLLLLAVAGLPTRRRPTPAGRGEDSCDFCKMAISDTRYGGEVRTSTGRIVTFDAVECLAGYIAAAGDSARVVGVWVADFDGGGMVPAAEARYVRGGTLHSPMGRQITSFAPNASPADLVARYGGRGHDVAASAGVVADAAAGGAGQARVDVAPPRRDCPAPVRAVSPLLTPCSRPFIRPRARRGACARRRHVQVWARMVLAVAAAAPVHAWGQGGVAARSAPSLTIEVSLSGPVRQIGDAVRSATPGARILVRRGTYREPRIVIDRPGITLDGEAGAIIDGSGTHTILEIAADDVTVRGLTLRNTGPSQSEERAGILVHDVGGCRVQGNRLEETLFAIYLAKVHDCLVSDNVIRGHERAQTVSGNGVHIWSSERVQVLRNDVRGHRDGIYFEFVKRGRVVGNSSQRSARYGMHFMFSDDCRYEDNLYRDNANGIAVMYSNRVEMIGNRFEHNWGAPPTASSSRTSTTRASRGTPSSPTRSDSTWRGPTATSCSATPSGRTAGRSRRWPTPPGTCSSATPSRGTPSTWGPTARPTCRASRRTTGTAIAATTWTGTDSATCHTPRCACSPWW